MALAWVVGTAADAWWTRGDRARSRASVGRRLTRYRPEIDGLRALAIIPVILFHAGFETFKGGFVGVDVFFVISGYLITGLILDEIKQGSFSIVRFYERRIRRILPALFFVCLVCIPFAWLWMLPSEFRDFSRSFAAVSLFVSNFYFWNESGYFEAATELKPLLHTWSLAVEEQFYILFPLLLLLLYKRSTLTLLSVVIVIIIISLGLAELLSVQYPEANFYLLPTRAWELGVGAVLGITAQFWDSKGWKLAEVASMIGVVMILYAVFYFDEAMPFPGVWGLVPVVGTALVIRFAQDSTLVGKALSLGPIVGIGLISYSIYLWHQPLFAFGRIRLNLDGETDYKYLLLCALAVVLAYLTWRFVEQPFRRNAIFDRQQVFYGAAIASVSILLFGVTGQLARGFPDRMPPAAKRILKTEKDIKSWREKCHSQIGKFIRPEDACISNNSEETDITILGDSHGIALSYELGETLSNLHRGVRELTYSSCPPVVGLRVSGQVDECYRFNEAVWKFLASRQRPEVVILIARWSLYMEGQRFDNTEGGIEGGNASYALPIDRGNDFMHAPERVAEVGRLYRASVERFLRAGKRVVLVYPVPEVGWNVTDYLAREKLLGINRVQPLTTSFEVFNERSRNAHQQLDLLGDDPNLIRIRPEDVFCNSFIPSRCVAELKQKPLYSDDDHLNKMGASMLAEQIVKAIKQKGWLNDVSDARTRATDVSGAPHTLTLRPDCALFFAKAKSTECGVASTGNRF